MVQSTLKCVGRRGSAPDSAAGSLQCSSNSLAGLREPTTKGQKRGGERRGGGGNYGGCIHQ